MRVYFQLLVIRLTSHLGEGEFNTHKYLIGCNLKNFGVQRRIYKEVDLQPKCLQAVDSKFGPTSETSPVSSLQFITMIFSSSFLVDTQPGQRLPSLPRVFAFDGFPSLNSGEIRPLHP